jgi:cytochrome c biogenesis protein CcdA
MMEIVLPVLGLAVVDSINPSALAATALLLLQPRATLKICVYMSAVFGVYFGLGVVLMLGLDALLARIGTALEHPIAYAVQGVIGVLMLVWSFVADDGKKTRHEARAPRSQSLWAVFLLGLTISAVEFSTAFPYLGAIGLMTTAGLAPPQWLPLLVVYNLILVAPPFALLGGHHLLGERTRERLGQWSTRFQGGSRAATLWIAGIVGFLLVADAVRYFDFFGLL